MYSGRIHGYYDAATIAAVRAFQSANGISPSGIVDTVTFYHIGLNNLVTAPRPLGIAWPPQVPSVVTCCSPLVSQIPSLETFGVAARLTNQDIGTVAMDVTGNALPAPSSFGPQYGQYAFVLTTPFNTFPALMVPLSPDDWRGRLFSAVGSLPLGTVTIYPTPAAPSTGPYEPAVLSGTLVDCQ